ncbi:hypothetical protein [Streptomyces sp. NBC_01565]|uniref:hypothetical protein n=1 Tax=Streptomyces sp. NBC_01565 TaxID=2975881 RepID=UPI00224FE5F8|nr:hypothetical protein [Streptomyces sp. NBC_01565]MCX4542314.1 hypothetical protein [Streptomyces sp. NBC_01565]
MQIRRKIATAAVTIAVAGTGMIAGTGSAFAGTNGQQITIDDASGRARSVYVQGSNQNGSYVGQCFNVNPNSSTSLGGWWWKNDVSVTAFSYSNCGAGRFYYKNTWINTTQSWGDYQVVSVH